MASQHVSLRAVGLILSATLLFVTLDALMKQLSRYYNVPFLVWVRYAIQAMLMAIWLMPKRGAGIVRTRNPRLQILRGALLTASSLAFFGALKYLPLAEAVALNYLAPLVVILLSTLFLGERMTPPRWAMLAGCLVGMLLIVRPGSSVLGPASMLALLAAGFYGGFQVLTRRLAAEDPLVTLFFPAIVGAAGLTLVMPFLWIDTPMTWPHAAIVILCGALGTFGHYLFIHAFRAAPASALAPFTYAQLVWATLIGWVAFGNFPDPPALVGMVVIAASGLLLAWRERQQRAGQALPPEGID